MRDWFRRETWTKTDEEEFLVKLSRAKKWNRPQYIRIQAGTLIKTKEKDLLNVAESLLKKMLAEYPDEKGQISIALFSLGEIYTSRKEFESALDYYRQSFEYEKIYPNNRTHSYLEYADIVVKTGQVYLFDYARQILMENLPDQSFPFQKYRTYSILSIIEAKNKKYELANQYAELADQYANSLTSGFLYHKELGIVNERDRFLDEMIKNELNKDQ